MKARISPLLLLFFLVALALFGSHCSTDFDVNAKYKEVGLAYMLLDKHDSVHYLKLNRLYVNTDGNAYQIAKNDDSLYFNDAEMEVILRAGEQEVKLYRVWLENKDDGTFSNPGQWVYRTPANWSLDQSKIHYLDIKNTRTGYAMSAQAKIVKDGIIQSPLASLSSISFASCNKERNLLNYIDRNMEISQGREARFYDFDLVFHYAEIDTARGSDTVFQSLTWPLERGLTGGVAIKKIRGEQFFAYVAQELSPKPGTKRLPLSVEFVYYGGGNDMYDYINVSKPTVGIVQKKLEYTNIENGLGIFSSRSYQSLTFELDGCTKRILAKGEVTKHLGFVR
ncbi:MAG: hypothetical protein HYZ16_02295 [Bacteroidetes bacterium]|jgi:hypothetical protein|nr:hypothetical protein [Bacteroidota bacterium]